MSLRGDELRRAIRVVIDTFGDGAEELVFVGSCVIGLYARRDRGGPLRATEDVDCISNRAPWTRQLATLAEMVSAGTLKPDKLVACRYAIVNTDVEVDIMSPEGFNVPATTFFKRAAACARTYDAGEGKTAQAVSPAYFLALKLEALVDRGDVYSKDAQDIVVLAVEVQDLVRDVRAAGIEAEIAALWNRAFEKLQIDLSYVGELVDAHIRGDEEHRDRAVNVIEALAGGTHRSGR